MRGEVGVRSESKVLDDDQFGDRYGALHFASTLTRGHEFFTSVGSVRLKSENPFQTIVSPFPREFMGDLSRRLRTPVDCRP